MNSNILQKAIAELKCDKPRMDYLLGLLETLYEMQDEPNTPTHKLIDAPGGSTRVVPIWQPVLNGQSPKFASQTLTDDASILDAKARANIDAIRALSEASKS